MVMHLDPLYTCDACRVTVPRLFSRTIGSTRLASFSSWRVVLSAGPCGRARTECVSDDDVTYAGRRCDVRGTIPLKNNEREVVMTSAMRDEE